MSKPNDDKIKKEDWLQYIWGPIITGLVTGLVLAGVTAILNKKDYSRKSKVDEKIQTSLIEKSGLEQTKLEMNKYRIKNLEKLSELVSEYNKAADIYYKAISLSNSGKGEENTYMDGYTAYRSAKTELLVILNDKNENYNKIINNIEEVESTIEKQKNGSRVIATLLDENIDAYRKTELENLNT